MRFPPRRNLHARFGPTSGQADGPLVDRTDRRSQVIPACWRKGYRQGFSHFSNPSGAPPPHGRDFLLGLDRTLLASDRHIYGGACHGPQKRTSRNEDSEIPGHRARRNRRGDHKAHSRRHCRPATEAARDRRVRTAVSPYGFGCAFAAEKVRGTLTASERWYSWSY
jgi:hypothetical protein